jgi:hypothetical protein
MFRLKDSPTPKMATIWFQPQIYACWRLQVYIISYRYEFPLGFQGGLTPMRRVDFLSLEKLEFAEMMLSKFLQFSKELLETSES